LKQTTSETPGSITMNKVGRYLGSIDSTDTVPTQQQQQRSKVEFLGKGEGITTAGHKTAHHKHRRGKTGGGVPLSEGVTFNVDNDKSWAQGHQFSSSSHREQAHECNEKMGGRRSNQYFATPLQSHMQQAQVLRWMKGEQGCRAICSRLKSYAG